MYVSHSFPTSDRTIRWIENLAEQEISLGSSDGAYDLCSTREEILATETLSFLNELRYHLEYMVRLFNGRLNDGKLMVGFAKDSSPKEGFSLIRNGIVLQIGSKRAGAIQLNCVRKNSDSRDGSVLSTGLVEGNFSTFHDVHWGFLGERVTSEKIACHFLTEFLQVSRLNS